MSTKTTSSAGQTAGFDVGCRSRNPFCPGKLITDAALFGGREALMRKAWQYCQDYRSLYITGNRGIGKSSFAQQLSQLLRGDERAFERFGISANPENRKPLLCTHRCIGTESMPELVELLLRPLRTRLERLRKAKLKKVKANLRLDLGILSAEVEGESDVEWSGSLIDGFCDTIALAFEHVPMLRENGICFQIDEVDLLGETIPLASFIKVAIDNLANRGIQVVYFVFIGIGLSLAKLKRQHKSIGRYVVPVLLPGMNDIEVNEIVNRALIGSGVQFPKDVRDGIRMFAQGSPDPVHQIGYELFSAMLESSHVTADLRLLHLAVERVVRFKNAEFEELRTKIPNGRAEEILLAIAMGKSETADIPFVSRSSGYAIEVCRKVCQQLVKGGFLEHSPSQGFKFSDELFRIYLRLGMLDNEWRKRRKEIFSKLRAAGYHDAPKTLYRIEYEKKEELVFNSMLESFQAIGKSTWHAADLS